MSFQSNGRGASQGGPAISLKTASKSVTFHENALIIPFRRGARVGRNWHAGVFDQTGAAIQTADMTTMTQRAVPSPDVFRSVKGRVENLEGKWLFGGIVSRQIGHIITRSMGRLWATEHLPDDAGLVFASLNYREGEHAFLKGILASLGISRDVRIVSAPTRISELVSAPDMFSEASLCVGNPDYAKWMRKKAVPKQDKRRKRKLYLTRGRLAPTVGRYLNEDILEANLEAAGFEVVAPETLSIDAQFKLFSEADVVVAAEGSALHILPFALRDRAKLCVIQRRSQVPLLIANQIKSFSKAKVHYLDAIKTVYWPEERADNLGLVSLDFQKIRKVLVEAKIIGSSTLWNTPTDDDIRMSLKAGRPDGARFLSDNERDSFLKNLRRQRRARRREQVAA